MTPGGQNPIYSGPQYNNVYSPRFPYSQNSQTIQQQYYPQQQQQYAFNPVARIQVQQEPSEQMYNQHFQQQEHEQTRLSFPRSANEYQVDQKAPSSGFQSAFQQFQVPRSPPMPQIPSPPSSPEPTPAQNGPIRLIPPFLKSASVGDQDKFYEIVQHPTWSAVEKNRKIEEFMKTMNEERQNMYTNYRQEITKTSEDRRRDVDQAVNSMSKGAFEEFQKVVSIMRDTSQPENLKLRKIEEIYSKLPDSIRKEFDSKLKGF